MSAPNYTFTLLLKDLLKVRMLPSKENEDDFGEGMSFAYAGESLFEPGIHLFPFQLPSLERELKMINLAIDNSIKEIVCKDNKEEEDVL